MRVVSNVVYFFLAIAQLLDTFLVFFENVIFFGW